MKPNSDLMRFGSDTPLLEAPALIGIAVAVVAFVAWLAAGTRDPDAFDVLKWIAAGVIGVVGIAYAGSWHEVVVDAAARKVIERHGFLQYPMSWLGQQLTFSDITAVIVEQKTSEDTEPAGTSMSRSTRTVYRKSYTLSLRRADSQVVLPEGKIAVPHYALDLPVKERNPPFNDSDWRGELLKDDKRWVYGVPPAGNANYAWVQHFIHHLAPTGLAGSATA